MKWKSLNITHLLQRKAIHHIMMHVLWTIYNQQGPHCMSVQLSIDFIFLFSSLYKYSGLAWLMMPLGGHESHEIEIHHNSITLTSLITNLIYFVKYKLGIADLMQRRTIHNVIIHVFITILNMCVWVPWVQNPKLQIWASMGTIPTQFHHVRSGQFEWRLASGAQKLMHTSKWQLKHEEEIPCQ